MGLNYKALNAIGRVNNCQTTCGDKPVAPTLADYGLTPSSHISPYMVQKMAEDKVNYDRKLATWDNCMKICARTIGMNAITPTPSQPTEVKDEPLMATPQDEKVPIDLNKDDSAKTNAPKSAMSMTTKVGIGIGIVALIYIGYRMFKKKSN